MELESIEKGISLLVGIVKRAFSFVSIVKAEERIIDDAAERMLNHLDLDSNQTASFLCWLGALKLDTFVTFRINDLETAIAKLVQSIDGELVYLGVPSKKRKECGQIITEALYKIGKKEKPLDYITHSVDHILAKQDKILKAIQNENLSYDTFFTLDASWRAKTSNPNIGIGFFSIENPKEKEKIQEKIEHNTSFYVSYYCREEAVAMLATSITNIWPGKRLYVINNFKTWEYFKEQGIDDSVFLCNFEIQDLQTVDDVPGNSCVYFVGKDESGQSSKDTIPISRRTQRRFGELLKEAGCSIERGVRLTKKTNGLFYPFKAAIWKGVTPMYDEFKRYPDCIKLLLCFPTFMESDLDYLSSFLPDFKEQIEALSRGENPLVIYPKSSWSTRIHLADYFAAWAKFKKIFRDNGDYLLSHSDCLKRTDVSKELKRGYISSLTYFGCYFGNESQRQADDLVSRLLQDPDVYSIDGHCDLDLYQFAEASPKSVLGFIRRNKGELVSLFDKDGINGPLFSPHTKITLALKTIAAYPEYAKEVYRLAAYFAAHESLGDNPVHPTATDLISCLCIPWFNYSGLSAEDRVKLAKSLFKEYGAQIRKGFVHALVTSNSPGISIGLDIRIPNESSEVTNEDYFALHDAFTEMLIDNGSLEELSDLMTHFSTIRPDGESLKKASDRLLSELPASTDDVKYNVSSKLRRLIHDSRYFNRPYFADKKDYLQFLTDLVENLAFSDDRYLYLHVFSDSVFSFPLLDPIPYREDQNDVNAEKIDHVINATLKKILDPSFGLDGFLKLLKDKGMKNWVPDVFGHYKHFDEYEPRVVDALCENGFHEAAYRYMKSRTKFSGEKMIDALEDSDDATLRALILWSLPFTRDTLNLVSEQSLATQEEFWKRAIRASKVDSLDLFEEIAHNLKRFDLAGPYVEFVISNASLIGANQVVDLLSADIDFTRKGFSEDPSLAWYSLETVLEECASQNGHHQIDRLWAGAELELEFRTYLGEHLHCLRKYCCYKPDFYARLLRNVFGDDDIPEKEDVSGAYVLLSFELRFCPGYIDGVLNKEIFSEWVDSYLATLDGKLDSKIVYEYLGRLLGYSMELESELPLPKGACEYIESHPNDDLQTGLYLALSAPEGVFSHEVTDGSNLRRLANSYRNASVRLKEQGYSEASNAFDKVASSLYRQADKEWEDAVNGGH